MINIDVVLLENFYKVNPLISKLYNKGFSHHSNSFFSICCVVSLYASYSYGSETKLDWKTIEGIAEDVPCCSLAYDAVLNLSLVDLLVSSGLFESKSAARRLLKQGGLYLNNNRVDNEGKRIEAADIVDGKVLLLSAGKKNKVLVRIV